ncbi:MAG: hypothetical protein DRP01_09970, partial [Archaeoglobales archaeon]
MSKSFQVKVMDVFKVLTFGLLIWLAFSLVMISELLVVIQRMELDKKRLLEDLKYREYELNKELLRLREIYADIKRRTGDLKYARSLIRLTTLVLMARDRAVKLFPDEPLE